MTDNLTLVPEYRFEWEDGTTRTTTDSDFVEDMDDARFNPEAIEALAELGRQDDSCEVTLLGMGA